MGFEMMCLAFAGFILFLIIMSAFFVVKQQTVAVIERFGKFTRMAESGLRFKIPMVDRIAARVNMRVQQLDVVVETKTQDDVFVHLKVSVQFFVIPEKVYEAYYKLSNVHQQVTSFVFDLVHARVPKLKLDDLFEKKDEIADAVRHELSDTMEDFGYAVLKALVTDIDPDAKVKEAMNEINAATRMRMAAAEKGEADRILKVKAAEAEAQSKALQGKGIADQRKAIIEGLRDSVEQFQQAVEGSSAKDVMMLVLMTQYFDTLQNLGEHSHTNTILMPHSPGGLNAIADQIRDAMITAGEANKKQPAKPQ
ncbi:MAG TPA: SPFH domain-containing protein [bacterium]|nr:SPFH domain-containing protein [bacterium]